KLEDIPLDYWPIVILDDIEEPGAAGYHTDQNGQPFALVQADSNWVLTVSHECLEMLADPFGNRTLAGPPPQQAPSHIHRLRRLPRYSACGVLFISSRSAIPAKPCSSLIPAMA